MKYFLALSFFLLLQFFIPERTIPTRARDFSIDNLGFIYLVYSHHIEKLTNEGKKLFRTSDLNFGEIRTLDVTNPLRPFIYYKEQGKIVVLDNTLSQQGEPVDLYTIGQGQVELVAGSRGDAFWLWDVLNAELIRVDQQFRKMNSTGNLATLLGVGLLPVQVVEKGSYVYLVDPVEGIFVFDLYGNYRTRIKAEIQGRIVVSDERIFFRNENDLSILEPDKITEKVIAFPDSVRGDFQFFRQRLYILNPNGLGIYRLSE